MKQLIIIAALFAAPLSGRAQLQNMDFEDWTGAPGSYKATGWVWTNSVSIDPTSHFRWDPEQPAQKNNYAIKLGVWYNYTKDAALQVAPIQSRPAALTGYYKYTDNVVSDPNGNPVTDIAQVSVYLTRWNTGTAERDTIGAGVLDLGASEDYKEFRCNISYSGSSQPDTIHVLLDCSLVARGGSGVIVLGGGTASYFTVDNLALDEGSLDVRNTGREHPAVAYPNPTRDHFYLKGFTGKLAVYDMTGARVLTVAQVAAAEPISLRGLPAGIYMLQMNSREGTQYQSIVKQ